MYVIGVYDINTEDKAGQRRLNRVFKIFKRFLIHIQNSVFEGELTKAQLAKLEMEIKKIIDSEKDSIFFFTSRDMKWLDKKIVGHEKRSTDNIL